MRGKRVLGMLVVMAMVLTAMPLLTGNAKASSNTDHVPSYLVVVRKSYGSEIGGYTIDKTIGNAYQDDKFGVEVIVHVQDYTYRPHNSDIVSINLTGIGVKGSDAGDYKVEWLEIDSTKFSFEERNSDVTPYATDYVSSIEPVGVPDVLVGLKGSVQHPEIKWFANISDEVASTATSLAIDAATGGAAGPLSGLAGNGAGYIVNQAITHMFNINNAGKNYAGSDKDPWQSTANEYTYAALRGVNDGNSNPDKTLIGRSLQWNLFDGINDRIHALTLKATLCYAKYGPHGSYIEDPISHVRIPIIARGWYDEHKISTSVTISVVPTNMAHEVQTRGGSTFDMKRELSDPANYNSYFLKITGDDTPTRYGYSMPLEAKPTTPRTDSGDTGRTIFLYSGHYGLAGSADTYYYYKGALPAGDSYDVYKVDFTYNTEYLENYGDIWIYSTGSIHINIRFAGQIQYYTLKGGQSILISNLMHSTAHAYITISKVGSGEPTYIISPYTVYLEYNDNNGGGSGGGGSGGGGIPGPGHGIHITSAPPTPQYVGDVTAPNSP